MKVTENFEQEKSITFIEGKRYTLNSGVIVELWQMDPKDKEKGVVKPTGLMEPHARKWNSEQINTIFGNMELVIGDASKVRFTFPKAVKDLKFQYYQVMDYSKEDEAYSGKHINSISTQDCYFFRAFLDGKEVVHMQVPPAFDEIRWGEYTGVVRQHGVRERLGRQPARRPVQLGKWVTRA